MPALRSPPAQTVTATGAMVDAASLLRNFLLVGLAVGHPSENEHQNDSSDADRNDNN